MRPQRNRYGVGLVPVLLLILWLLGLPTAAAAAQGSLELRCTVRRENKIVCLAGDEYALTLVAAAQETQMGLQYQTLPAYAFADCDWANCNSSQLREKARQLATVAQKQADYCGNSENRHERRGGIPGCNAGTVPGASDKDSPGEYPIHLRTVFCRHSYGGQRHGGLLSGGRTQIRLGYTFLRADGSAVNAHPLLSPDRPAMVASAGDDWIGGCTDGCGPGLP